MNFSSPLTFPRGCWRVLSLQLLSKTLPINQLFSLSLHTSFGAVLTVPIYFRPTHFKVKMASDRWWHALPGPSASQMCSHWVCSPAGGRCVWGGASVRAALLPQVVWIRWVAAPKAITQNNTNYNLAKANFWHISKTLQVAPSGSVPSCRTFSPRPGWWTANWQRSSALAGRAAKTSCPAGHSQTLSLSRHFVSLSFYLSLITLFSFFDLRWPRLPAETSLPLDFGATPVNESKVGISVIFFKMPLKCLLSTQKKWSIFLAMCLVGQDVHAEESLLISGLRGDSNPVPVLCPSGGLGPPDKMVMQWPFVPCASAIHSLCMSRFSPPPPPIVYCQLSSLSWFAGLISAPCLSTSALQSFLCWILFQR